MTNVVRSTAVFLLVLFGSITVSASPYEDALRHYRAGRYADAIAALAPKKDKSAGDFSLLAWAYLQTGDFSKSRDNFAAAIAKRPDIADPHCGMGYLLLRAGDVEEADRSFDRGISLASNNVDCLVGKGLASKRLNDPAAALSLFERALKIDSKNETALEQRRQLLGAKADADNAPRVAEAMALHRKGEFATVFPLLEKLARDLPGNPDVHLMLADTHVRLGRNLEAARIYRSMIERRVGAETARERFVSLYGYPEYPPNAPLAPQAKLRPPRTQLFYRTAGDYFEYFDGKQWRKTYLQGVNIGPARPGEFASTVSRSVPVYLEWLRQIAAMNANMVRVYTILPPAFYHALKIHNERAPKPMWLLQEVWLDERDEKNLYDTEWKWLFEQEIRYVVDLLHGNADIPFRRGHAWGIYTADVSQWTFALGPGREVEPSIVIGTTRKNPSKTSFNGTYVKVAKGNPAEVWFAEMIELAIDYEMKKYNAQRPQTIINWPPLDPMTHVSEATYAEELEVRRKRGENITEIPRDLLDDADVAVVDIMKLQATSQFPAGLFGAFHVYTHWPDFLFNEPEYPLVRDPRTGKGNRYYGYLRDLKKHHPGVPLLIAEYGVPTSWGVAHIHPDGWHNGGFTETEQAQMLAMMSRNIYDSGSAGGLVFAWKDEWWKCVADVATNPFDVPQYRRPLWLNMLNPEELFGILGYKARGVVPQLRGAAEEWRRAKLLATAGKGPLRPGDIRNVYAFSDLAFLYLRLDVEKGNGGIDLSERQYWIAINTLPGGAGTRKLSPANIEIESGANFLVRLDGRDKGRILVATNYNPNEWVLSQWYPGGKRSQVRRNMTVSLQDAAGFEEVVIEANQPRYGRDGTVFPPKFFSRSPLAYGTAVRGMKEYSSDSAWRIDDATGMIEVRIPWGYMYVTDPSARNVMTATDEKGKARWGETPGFTVAALAVTGAAGNGAVTVVDSLPNALGGKIAKESLPRYLWENWDEVTYKEYLKESYDSVRDVFGELDREFVAKTK